MTWISDRTVDHLRSVADRPEVPGSRYEVLDRIARGGMGTVYIAEDWELGRRVALKVLNVPGLDDEARERMAREARVLARLEHPGIVPVHDVGILPDGRVFYVMKLVDGERLDEHVRWKPGLRDRLGILERICEAVSFAHARGVVHRDLKPANVMVGPFGEVLVMDWGLAKILADDADDTPPRESGGEPVEESPARGPAGEPGPPGVGSADRMTRGQAGPARSAEGDTLTLRAADGNGGETLPGTILGTPGYMSPEQAIGRTDLVGERSDVYALGAILRDLVEDVAEPVPRRLRAMIERAMAEDPASRYPQVADLAGDLRRFLAGDPVSAYREGLVGRAVRIFQTYRTPILLVLAYLLVRALVLAFQGS